METASAASTNSQKPRRSPNTYNPPPKASSVARHERLCKICQHPQREDIEDDILRWRSPQDIVYDFDLGDRSVVYRHGRALNLFSQRKENLNPALERVIESVYDAKPSMNAVLKALAIYARVNGNEAYKAGFIDPPRRTIITHITADSETAAARIAQMLATAQQLEHPAAPAQCTQTKTASPSVPAEHPEDTRPEKMGSDPARDCLEMEPAEAHPAANLSSIDKLRSKLAEVLESRPDLAKALATVSCAVVILASLFLTSCTSSLPSVPYSSASPKFRSVLASGVSPLATSHSPLPFSYSPQNLRSQNANLLKTRGKAIFYSPQNRTFHGRFAHPQRANFQKCQSVEGTENFWGNDPAEDASGGTGGFNVEAGDA